jgi:2-haloacid dehalogenase
VTDRWATFDCYGTLIDWIGGIRSELARIWPNEDADRLLERYQEIEPDVQAGNAIPYREVLSESLQRVAASEALALPADERDALARSLPEWPVFPEVPASLRGLHERGWKLVILSNTDPDLLDVSFEAIGIEPDRKITALEAGSYKPARGHWDRFFESTGAERVRHVHVAASLFHDVAPAAEMGLTAVWVNRLGERSELPRAAELPDLRDLPDTLDALVPG